MRDLSKVLFVFVCFMGGGGGGAGESKKLISYLIMLKTAK